MQFKGFMLIFMVLLVILISIGSVVAIDSDDINNTELLDDDSLGIDDSLNVGEKEILENGKEIIVDSDDAHNIDDPHVEMSDPTIQKAINEANDGDTIIINGQYYQHCHFTVDKNLTIKSYVGTVMTPCSSSAVSGYQGIFYFTSKASGSVIEGFTLSDQRMYFDSNAYGILINGASDIAIRNCTIDTNKMADSIRLVNAKNIAIENVTLFNSVKGINIKNSNCVSVRNSTLRNNDNGVNVVGSTSTYIRDNNIFSNNVAGINVGQDSSYTTIISNNITNNKFSGVNLTSSEHVYILSNYLAANKFGVYVNCNITEIKINGNFFNRNTLYEIYDDYRTRNLGFAGGEKLQEVNNNYMIGYGERPVYNNEYVYVGAGNGPYTYDAVNDVYNNVGEGNGLYDEHKTVVFLGYVFEINENVACPVIYYKYGQKQWAESGNYELTLSNLTQVKKGVYTISIVNDKGEIATDLSSIYVTFYLNKNNAKVNPQEGDVYKKVLMKNGTATVRFNKDDFHVTSNVVTAVVPNPYTNILPDYSKTLSISDDNIPGEMSDTKITISNMTTYPKSNEEFKVVLTDLKGAPVSNELVTINVSSEVYNVVTDENGAANLNVSKGVGTYNVVVSYAGDDSDYAPSTAEAKIFVKKVSTKIISSNVNMIPKMSESYSITLKDSMGNPLSNQKVTFKVNKKTYTKWTNSKGVASVSLKFTDQKSYKIIISFAGDNKYGSVSKTNTINVKYSSKIAKLYAPSITIAPKTSKSYTVTLKDGDGKAISKQKVTINVNGKTYTKTTNGKGQATISVKFAGEKTYKVNVKYDGSKIYKKASTTGKIKVEKINTKITAPTVSALPKESKTYTITLKTGDGKALSKQKVTIKINGKTYTKTTNNKGQTSISVNFAGEKTYSVAVNYKGTEIYKSSKATGKVVVSKLATEISSYNRTFSKDLANSYQITLKDAFGNAVPNQQIKYSINNVDYTQTTDSNGRITLDFTNQSGVSFNILAKYDGSNKYKSSSSESQVNVLNQTGIVFIDNELPSSEIQNILDSASDGANVEFLGDYYDNVSLNIVKSLNIYSKDKSLLKTSSDLPVLSISADNVNITNLIVIAKTSSGILINNSHGVVIFNNSISRSLDESKIEDYVSSIIPLPGYGITVSNSSNISILDNNFEVSESGVFAEYSSEMIIDNNVFYENNYGIKYGFGVSNTQITNNFITESTGLYTKSVPEGPRGYGIFLNNSAVNVTISKNNITWNHLGISIDANYSTGIVIISNLISDNVLEGIRFNAGYDLAKDAVEPLVTDNAIYRNARGPSMMILGEMSANPMGIYGNGLSNDSAKLKVAPNWYGKNEVATWDNDTGVVGYGTMCPRIKTSTIKFNDIECISPGNYSITFYKNGQLASNLPKFDLFATLNGIEVNFLVVDGVGSFSFNKSCFNNESNVIYISIGSLNDGNRLFEPIFSKTLTSGEIL